MCFMRQLEQCLSLMHIGSGLTCSAGLRQIRKKGEAMINQNDCHRV